MDIVENKPDTFKHTDTHKIKTSIYPSKYHYLLLTFTAYSKKSNWKKQIIVLSILKNI